MPKDDESWLEDESFTEFGCVDMTGQSPISSGYNILVAGGQVSHDLELDENEIFPVGVTVYQQYLDGGQEFVTTLTPEAARDLARLLERAADTADAQKDLPVGEGITVNQVMNGKRTAWKERERRRHARRRR